MLSWLESPAEQHVRRALRTVVPELADEEMTARPAVESLPLDRRILRHTSAVPSE
jgi:plasmid stabilization system protein ParE